MSGKELKALLIEDSRDDVELIIMELEEAGFKVQAKVVDTVEELDKALKLSWDIVISDYAMPALSGMEALEMVRKMDQNIPFILVSGTIGEDIAVTAMKKGAQDYIMKDKLARLGPAIERELQEVKVRQERKKALESLRTSEARIKSIFVSAPIGMGMLSQQNIKFVNDRLSQMLGYPSDELNEKDSRILYDSDEEYEKVESMLKDSIQKSGMGTVQTKFLKKDGETLDVLLSRAPLDLSDLSKGSTFTVQDISIQIRSERVKNVLFQVATAVNTTKDLPSLLISVRDYLSRIVDTTNFYIALYEKSDDSLVLPLFIDQHDNFGKKLTAEKTLTKYAINRGEPVLLRNKEIEELVNSNVINRIATPSKCWLGVPLKINNEVIGLLGLQSYQDENDFSEHELELLGFVSEQIAIAIKLKEAQKSVEIQKRYFQNLFENSPDAIVILDHNDRILKINRSFTDLFEYTTEDALGHEINDLIVPEGYKIEAKLRSKHVFESEEVDFETIRKSKSGKNIHVSVKGKLIRAEDNKIAVYGIYRDISEKVRADQALKESENRYRVLANASSEAIFISQNGYCIDTNEAATKIFGYSYDEFMGMHATNIIAEESRELVMHNMLNEYGQPYETVAVRKDGSRFYGLFQGRTFDHKGKRTRITTVLDLTLQKNSERELIKAKNRAEESDRLKSAFLANMSHEIRTPMNAILGFSQLLHENNMSDKDREKYVGLVNSNGQMLLRLIEDIIDVSRIEAGEMSVVESEFEVEKGMEEIYTVYNTKLKGINKKVSLKMKLPEAGRVKTMLVDVDRLKQIFNNLIGNAMKFTREGYIEFGYDLIPGKEEAGVQKKIRFFVKDTGIGIPEDKQDIIFDRFRQVNESYTREFGGTGLGLTITRRLVELMGGKIWVKSKPNEGSTFFVVLPYKKADEKPVKNLQEEGTSKKKSITSGKNILVVEDVESNYIFLEILLKREGFCPMWAKNAEEALRIANGETAFDLILMDIQLPKMNGYELTKQIKKIRNVPVIAQTAYASSGDRQKCIQAGCVDYVCKPVNKKELISKVKQYIDGSQDA